MPHYEYRSATASDLIKIWDKNIADNIDDDHWVLWKDEYIGYNEIGKARTFVVVCDDLPIGEGTLLFSPECSSINNKTILANGKTIANINALRIDKSHEGKGHISKLVRLMEEYAVANGCTTLTIGVEEKEARNRLIYKHWRYDTLIHSQIEENELVLYYSKEISARRIYTSNETLRLVEYKKCDDRVIYENWLDPDTQKGYNGVFVDTFDEFESREIKQRFFAMIQRNSDNAIIGAVGISPPETIPDLAIWIFGPYRRQGYGTTAFALSTEYAVKELKITELHAGVYSDNIGSRKMLERCRYIPYTQGNVAEKHYITGEEVVQLDFIYQPVNIRLAVPADAPDMAEIHARSWEVAYKFILPEQYIKDKNTTRLALFKRIITDDNYRQYVIEYNGKTVGIMCVDVPQEDKTLIINDSGIDDSYYELHGIYLNPDYYRKGIGTIAMKFAFQKARMAGKSIMILWVFAENINSIKFYEKCGFVADGASKIYNCGKDMECIRMRKTL